jgi:hypothetical protein
VTNAELYAPRYPATTLRQAITRLGIAELRRAAMKITSYAPGNRCGGRRSTFIASRSHYRQGNMSFAW